MTAADPANATHGRRRLPAAVFGLMVITAIILGLGQTLRPATVIASAAADTVVATLGDAGKADGQQWTQRGASTPAQAEAQAYEMATQALRQYRKNGDDRLLSVARRALQPWQSAAQPPLSIWLLRGRLAQTEHRFHEAAQDLQRLLAQHPGHLEAMWLIADAWRRAGAIDRARGACLGLALHGHSALASLCGSEILMSAGNSEQAARVAAHVVASSAALEPQRRQWALMVHADALLADGDLNGARDALRAAAETAPAPLALRMALAQIAIALHDPAAALKALDDVRDTDSALLHRALAARQMGDTKRFTLLAGRLGERYDRFDEIGVTAHDLHTRSRYALEIEDDPVRAHELALANWDVQKGTEDARLLSAAARAAGRQDTLARLQHWQQQWRHAPTAL